MEFMIKRTSLQGDKQPHEDAIKRKYLTLNGVEREGWFVSFDSLYELIEFCNKLKDSIIIRKDSLNSNFKVIEIYDDFRE